MPGEAVLVYYLFIVYLASRQSLIEGRQGDLRTSHKYADVLILCCSAWIGCARRLRTHVTVTYGDIKGQHYIFCSASWIYISRFRSFLISLIVLHFAIHVHFSLFRLPHLLHPRSGLQLHPPLPLERTRRGLQRHPPTHTFWAEGSHKY